MIGFKHLIKFRTTDIAVIIYMLITAILIIVSEGFSYVYGIQLLIRPLIFLLIVLIVFLDEKYTSKILAFIHFFYPIALLSYFYGETALLNHIFFSESLDSLIYGWDEFIFGFQPSLEFSISYPQKWFSELVNFGYFSYYLLTFGVSFSFFLLKPEKAERVIFIIINSFFIYYLIFIIFPVSGPQYYFEKTLAHVNNSGYFSQAVKLVQYYGEHPTGAFPSSHVGMVVIFLALTYKEMKALYWIIIPLFILIAMATVYIKAHYAIDVFAGLLSAPLVFFCSKNLFSIIHGKLSIYYS